MAEKSKEVILSIDASKKNEVSVTIEEETLKSSPTTEHKAQTLLQLIDEVLKKRKITLSKITGIQVNVEGESFTGVRIGITVANALAYVLRVPVNGNAVGKYVEPLYQGHYGGEELL